MRRSTRTTAPFKRARLAFRSLRWEPQWIPPPRFVALVNEDDDLDLVVVSTFDSLAVCCHEELLRTPINGLLRLVVDLNSRLSTTMKITDALTKSEDRLRVDIEAVLGYKRLLPTELQAPAITSRDSGLGLRGLLSVSQVPDAQAAPFTPPRTRQTDSSNSPNYRRKLTVSMCGKPRLEDLMEEDQETGGPGRSLEKGPIRRSDRQHSLTQGSRRDRTGEAATLPRARSLRNFQTYEGRRVSPRSSRSRERRSDRSGFDLPPFGSVIRAKPKLYHSLPTRRGRFSYELSSARNPRFRRDFRHAPTPGHSTSRHTEPHRLRKPSLELSDMDRLICSMLSVPVSAHRGRDINSDLQEFGVI